jgi:hypothetical protein
MKTIWYVRDKVSQGADFFMWSDAPDAEQQANAELNEIMRIWYWTNENDFEIGSTLVADDYDGEPLN